MKRLAKFNFNTAEEYDRIFKEETRDWSDERRLLKLMKYYKGGNFIDLGCLDSPLPAVAKVMSPKSNCVGIDIAAEAINEMTKRYPGPIYKYGSVYAIPYTDGWFSYAVMGELLEHLESPETAVKEAFRVLEPGGVLAISVPFEETELGEVDKEHHLWSFNKQDLQNLVGEYSGQIKMKVLRSKWFPKYKYCFPTLLVWAWKK